MSRIWVEKLLLTDFRSYTSANLHCGLAPVVLIGQNGAGKTNCLEAVSLLTAGRGLRSTPFFDLAHHNGSGGWAVSACLHIADVTYKIGTGVQTTVGSSYNPRAARMVRVDEKPARSSSALAMTRMLWLTPAMDGLFTGPASERRRFIDRFILSLDPTYATTASAYDRAMRQRNKALEAGSPAQVLDAIEAQMASCGVAVAMARRHGLNLLTDQITQHGMVETETQFPSAMVSLTGDLDGELDLKPSEDVLNDYAYHLRHGRDRDRAAGRSLIGPHRSDLTVIHRLKNMPAKLCSTGEQKALLLSLILAQARLIKQQNSGFAPLVLLDEIAAHLDPHRREALFSHLLQLEAQVWMTGTETAPFEPLRKTHKAQFFHVCDGRILPLDDAESLGRH